VDARLDMLEAGHLEADVVAGPEIEKLAGGDSEVGTVGVAEEVQRADIGGGTSSQIPAE